MRVQQVVCFGPCLPPSDYFDAVLLENHVRLGDMRRVDQEHPRAPNPHVAKLAVLEWKADVCQLSEIWRIHVRWYVDPYPLHLTGTFSLGHLGRFREGPRLYKVQTTNVLQVSGYAER